MLFIWNWIQQNEIFRVGCQRDGNENGEKIVDEIELMSRLLLLC